MKTVHLVESFPRTRIHPRYLGVKQPMVIYHSTEELAVNEPNAVIISTFEDMLKFVKYRLNYEAGWHDVQDQKVFIATGEKVVPDYVNGYDDVVYTPKTTDNCYIQLQVIFVKTTIYILLTSSGVWKVDLHTWNFSAGVRYQYEMHTSRPASKDNRMTYEERLNHILESKKIRLPFIRTFTLLFNPLSETFLDPNATVRKIFGTLVKAKDREKIIQSKKFQQIMMKELYRLMPSLKDALQETIKPEDFAKLMKQFVTDTVSSKDISVDDKIKSLSFVGEKTFPDVFGFESNLEGALLPQSDKPLQIGARKVDKSFGLTQKQEEKIVGKPAEEAKVIDEEKPAPDEFIDEELFIESLDDEELDIRSEEVDEIKGYSEE